MKTFLIICTFLFLNLAAQAGQLTVNQKSCTAAGSLQGVVFDIALEQFLSITDDTDIGDAQEIILQGDNGITYELIFLGSKEGYDKVYVLQLSLDKQGPASLIQEYGFIREYFKIDVNKGTIYEYYSNEKPQLLSVDHEEILYMLSKRKKEYCEHINTVIKLARSRTVAQQ